LGLDEKLRSTWRLDQRGGVGVGGVVAGQGLVVGSIFGVCATDQKVGDEVVISTVGVYKLPLANGASFDQGDPVWFDAAAGTCKDASSAGLYAIGVATEDSSAAVVRVACRESR
jgi:predicted RecA/RadA family phage recombinase